MIVSCISGPILQCACKNVVNSLTCVKNQAVEEQRYMNNAVVDQT